MPSLNLCCGRNKLKDCDNVDINEKNEPDFVYDIRNVFPVEDGKYDEVFLFHSIEHIESKYHKFIFREIHRVLKTGGCFYISYPEFERIAKNWLENKQGRREFWGWTIYGRQENQFDFHVHPMYSEEVKAQLIEVGFKDIEIKPEQPDDFNTIVKCVKCKPQLTYEEVLQNDIDKVQVIA